MNNIIKINKHHDYRGTKTYFIFIPNGYLWMYVLIYENEPFVSSFCFKPKFKFKKNDRKLETLYSKKEINSILTYLAKAAETTVDTLKTYGNTNEPK